MIEPIDKIQRETRQGTPYEIWKWICPQCNQERSSLFIDDELCHGDGQVSSFGAEADKERCIECWSKEIESAVG